MSADAQDLAMARADIDSAREKVARSVVALHREIARTMDWREWVSRNARLSIGVAFGLGLLLGRRRD